ncbi:MAG: DUF2851 family protein [Puniceicoccales bacterium]
MPLLPSVHSAPALEVPELPGEFGPVSISERVIQRIWLRQDFSKERLVTTSGKPVRVRRAGKWNLQEGPDFRDATLEIGGERVDGDVEIHFYPGDWFAHGHETDSGFDKVALHVVVFDDGSAPVFTSQGGRPETLALLPLLYRDLESYACEDALLALERRDHLDLLEFYLSLTPKARRAELRELGQTRYQQKCTYARQRLERLGWANACHQALLEVMGYRRNRVPMNILSERHPIGDMGNYSPAELFDEVQDQWKLAGLRPANHPRTRLGQYRSLLDANVDWPDALDRWAGKWVEKVEAGKSTNKVRRNFSFTPLRKELVENVLAGAVSGPRLDTLVVDVFLPLLAVKRGKDLFGAWHHWFTGDAPDALIQFLRESNVTDSTQPRCNGLLQGALQRFFTQGL